MRNYLLCSVLAFLGLCLPSQARADVCGSVAGNTVSNCGFETGSFSNWSVTGNLFGGLNGNFIYVDNSSPHSGNDDGNFGAPSTFGQTGSGNMFGPLTTLSEGLTVLPNEYYQVTFYLANDACSITDSGCGAYYNDFDAYFNRTLLSQQHNIGQSNFDLQGNLLYTQYSFLVGTGVAANNNGVLQFDFSNDDGNFHLDDVSVVAVRPTPEPATLLLAAPGLGALYFLRRRRSA
ncbi:MAG TPA: hypothetical protein VFA65_03305 [Bryobacteraceae bacterium]|nr:hypothetical protein [Bryobacteraceae bacterium]